jgi:glycosyltransferase involved in cell wall biosynthesis
MVGDGPLRAECESYAASRNLPVTFAGFFNQKAMPSAYAASDILVMTSVNDETWGLVVNEAMASGIPAVVSDKVGCAPDLVVPGRTGSLFPAGDFNALASIVASYANSPSRARAEGAAANARIQEYSLTAAVNNTIHAAERFAA